MTEMENTKFPFLRKIRKKLYNSTQHSKTLRQRQFAIRWKIHIISSVFFKYVLLFFKITTMATLISTDGEFTNNIATGLTLVDFWAEWCGPCQMMLPRLEELASKMEGKAKVMKHNVDTDPQVPTQFRIMSIPTIILFKDGQPVEKFVGVQDVESLVQAIEKNA